MGLEKKFVKILSAYLTYVVDITNNQPFKINIKDTIYK